MTWETVGILAVVSAVAALVGYAIGRLQTVAALEDLRRQRAFHVGLVNEREQAVQALQALLIGSGAELRAMAASMAELARSVAYRRTEADGPISDPPSVREADRAVVAARRVRDPVTRAADRQFEPLRVNDDELPPPFRLDELAEEFRSGGRDDDEEVGGV